MSDPLCTSEQCIAACSYLNNSFGGYPMTPDERRPYLRLFATYSPTVVRDAIDALARGWTSARRPAANDVAQVILAQHPKRRDEGPFFDPNDPALTPNDEYTDRVAELREHLKVSK
jgi:hypothetical protein